MILIAVIAILLGLVVIFMILWRTGRVKPETKRRLTMYLKRPVTMFQSSRKVCSIGERERERERDRQTDRQRQTETDRQTDRQTHRQTGGGERERKRG